MNEWFSLLAAPLALGMVLSLMLGYLGLHVLKREVIFIDIAVAQFAVAGAIIAHTLWEVHADSWQALAAAWGCTILAAAFYAGVRRRVPALPLEAVIGISYAAAAAGALLVIGRSAAGHTHVQQMLTGHLLWVGWPDVWKSGAAFLALGLLFYLFRKRFQRISDDYREALGAGLSVVVWDFLFYTLCGLVITLAVRLAGVVVVFCLLVIPSVTAALFARGWATRFLLAAAMGVAASAAGLLFAYRLDFSAGPSVALWLGLFLLAAALLHGLASRLNKARQPIKGHGDRYLSGSRCEQETRLSPQ